MTAELVVRELRAGDRVVVRAYDPSMGGYDLTGARRLMLGCLDWSGA